MSKSIIRLLRYNTGNDKDIFVKFKSKYDVVLFNANILVHSGAAIADLVSIHKNQYIIDPQTHIFQQNTASLSSSKTDNIKQSIEKYLAEMPVKLSEVILTEKRSVYPSEILSIIEELASKVYMFQVDYINRFIENKDYQKYLDFAKIGPTPQMVIAPYFMLKDEYNDSEIATWLEVNQKSLEHFCNIGNKYPVAAQVVIGRKVLISDYFSNSVIKYYSKDKYEFVILWIDDFSSFNASEKEMLAFNKLITKFSEIGKKVIMAYGGYDSILLCHSDVKEGLVGCAQSVGYGEARPVTPVGSGLPTNKYYFLPLHQRLRFDEASAILAEHNYFSGVKSKYEYALQYYDEICNCDQCHDVIANDIDNFNQYNDSIPFVIHTRRGDINRNRPTTKASNISAMHFMFCKVNEWNTLKSKDYKALLSSLKTNYEFFMPSELQRIVKWCKIFEK